MKNLRTWLAHPTRIGALLLLMFCVTYGWLAQYIPSLSGNQSEIFSAATVPNFLSLAGVVLATVLLLFPGPPAAQEFKHLNWLKLAGFLLLMSSYAFVLRPLGFLLSTLLFLSLSFVLLGERRWWLILLIAVAVSLLFWLLMSWGLQVYLPAWPAGAS